MHLVYVSQQFNQKQHSLEQCPPDELVLVVDVDRCIACGACALACRAEHAAFGENAPVRRLIGGAGEDRKGRCVVNLPTSCRQCTEPCALNNGYSFWTLCPGEKAATIADQCAACDECAARLREGYSPACVTRCCMKCLYAGRAEDVRFALEEKRLRSMGEAEIC